MTRARDPALVSRLAHLRPALGYALGFSIFVNIMLLAPTLYMLQVFDRVLTSRSVLFSTPNSPFSRNFSPPAQ